MNSKAFNNNREISSYIINHYLKDAKNVIIPSGSTPEHLYQEISKTAANDIDYYALDEWLGVSQETIGSCHQMITKDFISNLEGDFNFYGFDGSKTFEENCEMFAKFTTEANVDVAILGVGLNGHIGLNEKTDTTTKPIIKTELESITKQVANEKYFTSDTEVTHGMTFSLDFLLKAKHVLVVLNTPNKKDIWKVINESSDTSIPAVYLKKFENVTFLVTKELYE